VNIYCEPGTQQTIGSSVWDGGFVNEASPLQLAVTPQARGGLDECAELSSTYSRGPAKVSAAEP